MAFRQQLFVMQFAEQEKRKHCSDKCVRHVRLRVPGISLGTEE